VDESADWSSLCKNTTKELISREFLGALPYTNRTGKIISDYPPLTYRYVTNRVNAVCVRLDGLEHAFERPLVLDASREYFIQGPGTLSADIRSKGGEVRLHLKNCFLFNRSTVPIDKAGLRYVFEGGGYLNFTEQNELPRFVVNKHIEDFDYAYDAIRFKGPRTKAELDRERTLEIQGMLLRDVSR